MRIRVAATCKISGEDSSRNYSHFASLYLNYSNSEPRDWTRWRSLFSQRIHRVAGEIPARGVDKFFPENRSRKNTDLAMQPLKGHLNSKEVAASLKRCPDTNLEFSQPLKACLFQNHLFDRF